MDKFEAHKTEVDAKSLWTTIEVYRALNQPQEVTKYGEHLRSLFPNNEYTRKYLFLIKRQQRKPTAITQISSPSPSKTEPADTFHTMKKGETLYQLSKRYDVSIADLLNWNPDLVVDDISLGTSVRVSAN
jgi:LysM repeat protein